MRDYLSKIFTGDKILWGIIFILFIISGVEMFSAISSSAYRSALRGGTLLDPFTEHVYHLIIGAVAILVIQRIPYKTLRATLFAGCIVAVILLLLTPFLGKEVNGASRAIDLGFMELQTIEAGKFVLIFCLSEILGRNYKKGDPLLKEKFPWKSFWVAFFVTLSICGMIAVQNLSTAVMLGIISLAMMVIAEVDWKKIFTFVGIIIAVIVLVWGVHKVLPSDWQLERFNTWENRMLEFVGSTSSEDKGKALVITDENRQIINSEIAIAKGYKPCGPGNSTQRDYLPLAFSDFIFAILVEEWGLAGGIFTILLYLYILARAGRVAKKCTEHNIGQALIVLGLSLLIVTQAFISMGVTAHIGPVTGQQLPLISRGGMGIILTCCYLGVIINISNIVLGEKKEDETSVEPQENINDDQER